MQSIYRILQSERAVMLSLRCALLKKTVGNPCHVICNEVPLRVTEVFV